MSKKYSITRESKIVFGVKLFRIKAEMSFGSIKKGEFGGWIEKENNLAQSGDAWVSGDAEVSGDARVSGKFKLEFGWCFASIKKDWKISEVKNGDEILLIKDYKESSL